MNLSEFDQSCLEGKEGPAAASAMRVIVRLAETMEATELLDVTSAHIDSCLYHGPAVLDFAKWLDKAKKEFASKSSPVKVVQKITIVQ